MAILVFVNIKGGVAKTTNAIATAECFASQGFETLVIDADHQCAASELLAGEKRLVRAEQRRRTLHDLLASVIKDEDWGPESMRPYIERRVSNIDGEMDTLDMIPCSLRIDDFQSNLAKAKQGHLTRDEFQRTFDRHKYQMRKWLNTNYDFTIVDCPPSLAIQVKVFLTMADAYVIPSLPDRLSVRGSLWLLDRIRRSNIKTHPIGTLWSMYRAQNSMHSRTIEAAAKQQPPYAYLPTPFRSVIPNATAIAKSTESEERFPSFAAKYTPTFANLFRDLSKEIIERLALPADETAPIPFDAEQLWSHESESDS